MLPVDLLSLGLAEQEVGGGEGTRHLHLQLPQATQGCNNTDRNRLQRHRHKVSQKENGRGGRGEGGREISSSKVWGGGDCYSGVHVRRPIAIVQGFWPKTELKSFDKKRMPSVRACQEEQNDAFFSSVALSREDL